MKSKQMSDEVMQQQMNAFASNLRRATAADLSICLVQTRPDDAADSLATAVGIAGSGPEHGGPARVERDAAFAMLLTASQIIHKVTSGQVKVLIRSPSGDFPLEPGTLTKWLGEAEAT